LTLKNFKLAIAYDGTHFLGWQRQKESPTVQEAVETALSRVLAQPVVLHGSGRTDAGVHAAGQVASFLAKGNRTPQEILRGANSLLPLDIAILSVTEVSLDFHARFSAQGKLYSYDFQTGLTRDPLTHRFVWPVGPGLNWDLMRESFPYLLGEHDFAAFQSHGADVKSTVRTLTKLELTAPQPEIVRLSVTGTGFLRHMVRTLAGTLIEIAKGRQTPSDLTAILESRDRRKAGRMAPAQGLCLRRVYYEDWPF
jgi:tRNA pseudouridine38-40 synthase